MLRGYYTAASGMMAQQRRQETLSNNMANALTPGYKQDQGTLRAFPELLLNRMGEDNTPVKRGINNVSSHHIGSINTGVYLQETIPDFTQGALRETGVSTDMALVNGQMPDSEGNVFYTVQNEAGDTRYTRNGNFTVDGQGFLVTNQGNYVLDQEGNQIATGGLDFTVSADGVIQLPDGNIPLGIAYTADANGLVKEGNGLFRLSEEAPAAVNAREEAAVTFSVKQKSLESSNVDSLQSMTEAMQAYRLYETNQRVLRAYDQSMEKAVNEIGRLR